jgi:hypothetical protein
MMLPVIRDLAGKYTKAELDKAAELFETKRENPYGVQGHDEAEILTNLLMASRVREKVEAGMPLAEALRDHSQSVRKILTGLSKPKAD